MEQYFLLAAWKVSTVIPLQLGAIFFKFNSSSFQLILLDLQQQMIILMYLLLESLFKYILRMSIKCFDWISRHQATLSLSLCPSYEASITAMVSPRALTCDPSSTWY